MFGTASIIVEDEVIINETKTEKSIKFEKNNQLTITFKNGSYLSWFVNPWKGDDIVEPWKDFYNWFMNEKTKIFIKHYDNGLTLIQRDKILTFNINVQTKRLI